MVAAYTSHDPDLVKKSGDTMTGPLILSGDPDTDDQAATKGYVDTALAGGGGDVTSVDGMTGDVSLSGTYLAQSANLSDVGSVSIARTNLGLGGAAQLSVGTTSGTVAAGNDSRITGAAQKASNLSDLASAGTARTNLGLGGAALLDVGTTTGTVAAGDDSRFTDTRTPTDGSVTSAKIVDGTIVNGDISASAAIALSKLATDPLARANHTGTQTASTVSDFDTQVRTSRLDQMAAPTADVSMNSHKLTSVTSGSSSGDAVNKGQLDTKANLAGATFTGATVPAVATLTDTTTISVDASLGNHFRVTLGGNRTLGAPTNPTNGQKIVFEVIQDATGSRTLAYNAVYAFSTDIPSPTLTTTASKRDFLGFVYNSTTTKWYCLAVVKGF